jgi:hypothetical protein
LLVHQVRFNYSSLEFQVFQLPIRINLLWQILWYFRFIKMFISLVKLFARATPVQSCRLLLLYVQFLFDGIWIGNWLKHFVITIICIQFWSLDIVHCNVCIESDSLLCFLHFRGTSLIWIRRCRCSWINGGQEVNFGRYTLEFGLLFWPRNWR